MEKLLKIKHWQLFVAILAPIFLMQVIFGMAFSSASSPTDLRSIFYIMPLFILVIIGLIFGWQYAIIFKLKDKLPAHVQMPYGRIKAFILIPMLYFGLIFFIFFFAITENQFVGNINPGLFLLIVPLHLLSMFGIFHTMYFAAKTMKCAETRKNQSFGDFAGEFFLIWFYIIVRLRRMILQPRLNALMNDETNYSNDVLDDDNF